MSDPFFDHPILNSPYQRPSRHWELDELGQPTQAIINDRRSARFVTPIPPPRRRRAAGQQQIVFDEGLGLSTEKQQYNLTSTINEVRRQVDEWRRISDPSKWGVTPATQQLLQHWRRPYTEGFRPFYCQVEAVETAIWLTEVAPSASSFNEYLERANDAYNPGLSRLCLKRFRREIVERTRDVQAGENLTDQDVLREVMNTVGKHGRLGGGIRCVVSVSMLTEGWDANTVTHVLGVRAFGTQLLCEQVIGRALRRQSYDLNHEGLFNVEYADILGIPFNFAAKPVIAPPQPPRETIHVKAVRPDRDACEIRFPRQAGWPTAARVFLAGSIYCAYNLPLRHGGKQWVPRALSAGRYARTTVHRDTQFSFKESVCGIYGDGR